MSCHWYLPNAQVTSSNPRGFTIKKKEPSQGLTNLLPLIRRRRARKCWEKGVQHWSDTSGWSAVDPFHTRARAPRLSTSVNVKKSLLRRSIGKVDNQPTAFLTICICVIGTSVSLVVWACGHKVQTPGMPSTLTLPCISSRNNWRCRSDESVDVARNSGP
jgi:hypothetical protein